MWGLFKIEKRGGGLGNINLTDLASAKILKIRGTGRAFGPVDPAAPALKEGRGDAEKGRGGRLEGAWRSLRTGVKGRRLWL